jgi:hypothetical protein
MAGIDSSVEDRETERDFRLPMTFCFYISLLHSTRCARPLFIN